MKNEKGFVGYFKINEEIKIKEKLNNKNLEKLPIDFAFTQKDFLDKEEIDFFKKIIENQVNVPVGITGYYDEYKDGDKIGSYRGTIFNEDIANILFKRLKGLYPENRNFKESLNIDHDDHEKWEFIGINPLFRFIKYRSDGELIPHYDAPYIKNEKERSLVTMVIYLTNNKTGQTRFIKDPQSTIPVSKRNLSDWKEKANVDDVLFSVYPKEGKIALFDHRIIHDSQTLIDEEKIIIRTDLMFRKI